MCFARQRTADVLPPANTVVLLLHIADAVLYVAVLYVVVLYVAGSWQSVLQYLCANCTVVQFVHTCISRPGYPYPGMKVKLSRLWCIAV